MTFYSLVKKKQAGDLEAWEHGMKYSPKCEACGRSTGKLTAQPSILLKGQGTIPDFLVLGTWWFVTDRVKQILEQETRGVKFEETHVTQETEGDLPKLYHVLVPATGHLASKNHVKLVEKCDACGLERYTTWLGGMSVDEKSWDGSDAFRLKEHWGRVIVTEKFKQLVENHQFSGVQFVKTEEIKDEFANFREKVK